MDAQLRSLERATDANSAIRYLRMLGRADSLRGLEQATANKLWHQIGADVFDQEIRDLFAYDDPDAGRMLWIPPTVPGHPAMLGDPVKPFDIPRGFWMAETPVMQDGLPMANINWHEATAWCQERGLRLPHEIEWEYAARGTDGRTYPWGEETPPTNRAAGWMPASHASPFGLLGMSGTIWQWCQNAWNAEMSPDPTLPARPTASTAAGAGATSPATAGLGSASGSCLASGSRSSGSGPPEGEHRSDPTRPARPAASTAAGAGATAPATAGLCTASGSGLATGARTSGSGPPGERSDPTLRPTASSVAAAGTASPRSAARPTGSGSRRATGAGTSGSVPPGNTEGEQRSDPTRAPTASTAGGAGTAAPASAGLGTAIGASQATGARASGSVPSDDEQGSSSFRVYRGGSWRNGACVCRSGFRFQVGPGFRIQSLGFRPAR